MQLLILFFKSCIYNLNSSNNIQTYILFARAKLSFAQPKLWFAGIKL